MENLLPQKDVLRFMQLGCPHLIFYADDDRSYKCLDLSYDGNINDIFDICDLLLLISLMNRQEEVLIDAITDKIEVKDRCLIIKHLSLDKIYKRIMFSDIKIAIRIRKELIVYHIPTLLELFFVPVD